MASAYLGRVPRRGGGGAYRSFRIPSCCSRGLGVFGPLCDGAGHGGALRRAAEAEHVEKRRSCVHRTVDLRGVTGEQV